VHERESHEVKEKGRKLKTAVKILSKEGKKK